MKAGPARGKRSQQCLLCIKGVPLSSDGREHRINPEHGETFVGPCTEPRHAQHKQEESHGWNIEQILVYIWQMMSADMSEQDYPYKSFAVSGMGKRLRLELTALTAHSYAHMCRDEHVEIGHNDSEYELCPLCRAINEREAALAARPQEQADQPCGVMGFPEQGKRICELEKGHEGYHQQGTTRWLGYQQASQTPEAQGTPLASELTGFDDWWHTDATNPDYENLSIDQLAQVAGIAKRAFQRGQQAMAEKAAQALQSIAYSNQVDSARAVWDRCFAAIRSLAGAVEPPQEKEQP